MVIQSAYIFFLFVPDQKMMETISVFFWAWCEPVLDIVVVQQMYRPIRVFMVTNPAFCTLFYQMRCLLPSLVPIQENGL